MKQIDRERRRVRRSLKTKAIQRRLDIPRVVVKRTGKHIYAVIVMRAEKGDKVLASSSTLDKALKPDLAGNKVDKAKQVGVLLAKRAKENNIERVAFDRSGYRYHGRVKAIAEGMREVGLLD